MKHLQAVLAAVAAINEHDRPATPDDILVRVRNASQAVQDSIDYAEARGYLEPAGRRGFWITAAGGDAYRKNKESPVDPAVLIVSAEGGGL
jgi:hypothetical protein